MHSQISAHSILHHIRWYEGIPDRQAPENKLKQTTLWKRLHFSSGRSYLEGQKKKKHTFGTLFFHPFHIIFQKSTVSVKHLRSIFQIKNKLINSNGRQVLGQDFQSILAACGFMVRSSLPQALAFSSRLKQKRLTQGKHTYLLIK